MKHLLVLPAVMTAVGFTVGCSTTAEPLHSPTVAQNYWAEQGIRRVGEEFVHEGYMQNGVIVTPSKNWFFGQGASFSSSMAQGAPASQYTSSGVPVTDAEIRPIADVIASNPVSVHPPLPDGGQKLLVEGDTIDSISSQFGGMVRPDGATARRQGTARSLKEMQAYKALDIAGRYLEDGQTKTYERLDNLRAKQLMSAPEDGSFNPLRIMAHLDMMDPSLVQPINGRLYQGDDRTPVPLFDLGKANLKEKYMRELENFAADFHHVDNLIVVGGYTDPSGPPEINERLAKERSESVGYFLRTQGGLDDRVLLLYGRPQCCYVEPNTTERGRAMNRRAEISVRGLFLRVDASNSESLAKGLARAFRTMGGDETLGLRVYGVAPSDAEARQLALDMKAFLKSEQIGLERVGLGESAKGLRREIVVEIVEDFGDIK